MNAKSLTVIIPTLNGESTLEDLLKGLRNQTYPINEIVIVDSQSTDNTKEIVNKYEPIRVININRQDFDHGRTRDFALRTCNTEYVVFMTQDACPLDEFLIEELVKPLENPDIVISTARQIPREDASSMERFVRFYNYPDCSTIRSADDIDVLGIKTFFFSDVCAAYKRDIYEKLGGFEYPLKTNEDMFFAAKVINAGYKIAYVAEAKVIHSHNYSLKQQYNRNYIQGFEIEKHKALLSNVKQEAEGFLLVREVSKELIKNRQILSLFRFCFDCLARVLGSRNGRKQYKKTCGVVGT